MYILIQIFAGPYRSLRKQYISLPSENDVFPPPTTRKSLPLIHSFFQTFLPLFSPFFLFPIKFPPLLSFPSSSPNDVGISPSPSCGGGGVFLPFRLSTNQGTVILEKNFKKLICVHFFALAEEFRDILEKAFFLF